MDYENAAAEIWRGWLEGAKEPAAALAGKLSFDQAYGVQLALLRLAVANGERQAGWKVGLTASAIRAQFNAKEPVFGFLLESGHRPSSHAFRFSELIAPGYENELCLTVAERLRGPGVSLEQAARAVSHAAPALEIVENRGAFATDIAMALADNAQQKAFVTGAAVPLDATNRDLGRATVAVDVNGALREEASAREVMGEGPLLSVVWLANKLAEFGLAIEAGSRIMSGSFTKQYRPEPGDTARARFTPFGTVSAQFLPT